MIGFRCSNASKMEEKTGDLLRLRRRRRCHLLRPLDLSGIRPNRRALTFEFRCEEDDGNWCRTNEYREVRLQRRKRTSPESRANGTMRTHRTCVAESLAIHLATTENSYNRGSSEATTKPR